MQLEDDSVLSVLAVFSRGTDSAALERIFSHTSWRLDLCQTLAEARVQLRNARPGVVICDRKFADGNWKHLLRGLPANGAAPKLIVALPAADARLWAEVLNLGGYDALVKPFDSDEVVRLVSVAWLSWRDTQIRRAPERLPLRVHRLSGAAAMAS